MTSTLRCALRSILSLSAAAALTGLPACDTPQSASLEASRIEDIDGDTHPHPHRALPGGDGGPITGVPIPGGSGSITVDPGVPIPGGSGSPTVDPGVPIPGGSGSPTVQPGVFPVLAAGEPRVLRPFNGRALQIDLVGEGPGNANLVSGPDPTDGSPSRDFPECGAGSFIDWEDLAAQRDRHQLRDIQSGIAGDGSAFPDGDDCVSLGRPPMEADLLYAAASSNRHYAYLAVQRASDPVVNVQRVPESQQVAFTWLFTREKPRLHQDAARCARGRQLRYDLRKGDVLLTARFLPEAGPALRAYVATHDEDDVDASEAIEVPCSRWMERPEGVFSAVNTDATTAGAFGSGRPIITSMPMAGEAVPPGDEAIRFAGTILGAGAFVEAAVPMALLAGDASCGVKLHGSIISHSPRRGAEPVRLYDLVGPAEFDFSMLQARAKLSATCDRAAGFAVSNVVGSDGMPLAEPGCALRFDDGSVAGGCHGVQPLPAGRNGAVATITDPASGCVLELPLDPIDVYEPLSVAADIQPTCAGALRYSAQVSGGSSGGAREYAWKFQMGDQSTGAVSNAPAGLLDVSTSGVDWNAQVTVSERRGSLLCQASAEGNAAPLAPFSVELLPTAFGRACGHPGENAVDFQALVTGGPAVRVYEWPGLACDGPICRVEETYDEPCITRDISVRVKDPTGVCPDAVSATAKWVKVTEVRVVR